MPGTMPMGCMPGIIVGAIMPIGKPPAAMACCMPICIPICMPIPRTPVSCGQALVRWSPPQVAQTQTPGLSPESRALPSERRRDFSLPPLLRPRRTRRSFVLRSRCCFFGRFSSRRLPSSSADAFNGPSSPRAQDTSARIRRKASSRFSGSPNIRISRSVLPGSISVFFWTFTSAPVRSLMSLTVSPPVPMTRPASESFTHSLNGGVSSAADWA
mmetsp:Transcript_33966/g.61992  ORF Transcript_33966/g.61992 Transcript_33966/m.61992 type:complete len:214 (-) Transcript_33966:888-1529(-)